MKRNLVALCGLALCGALGGARCGAQAPGFVPLEAKIYDPCLGTYEMSGGELIVISRSARRLYAYQPGTESFRGLERRTQDEWIAGPSSHIYSPVEREFLFVRGEDGAVKELRMKEGAAERLAQKAARYNEESVTLNNGRITLAGTLLTPSAKGPHPAIVIGHGSGPQDRNGHVSYIRLLADNFARHGIAVLTYDKRGVGASSGNWAQASFADLADDLLAAVKQRDDIDSKKVGVGGSSQAGWIISKAIEKSNDLAFVITISAGGSGLTAAQQNLYNTETEMRVAGIPETEIKDTITALNALYEFVRTGTGAKEMDDAIKRAQRTVAARDWLPPLSREIDRSKPNHWFTALEIDFDPAPAWAKFSGPVLAIFGELDTSTPTRQVIPVLEKALASRPNSDHTIKVFPKAHHLILEAETGSDEELPRLKRFVPGFFDTMTDWLKARVQPGATSSLIPSQIHSTHEPTQAT